MVRFQFKECCMSEDTIFGRIHAGELPAIIVYEDDLCLVFRVLYPAAHMHILLIPRTPIPRLCDSVAEDQALLGHLMLTASKIAAQEGFGEAYRLVVNIGEG